MTNGKKRIVVVCPGRGSYTQKELGYLKRYARNHQRFITTIDNFRKERGEITISELDAAEKFSVKTHTPGENASALIYGCSLIDFLSIDRERYEIVAITGNSMGWYLTLAFSGALNEAAAFTVINTMGTMMREKIIGGQILYPIVDDNWQFDAGRLEQVNQCMESVNKFAEHEVHHSIYLGGYMVIGGDDGGLKKLAKLLPAIEDTYPMRLVNHAAFHTPMLKETSEKAFQLLGEELFSRPEIPIIDGRGHIWQTYSSNVSELRDYTLGHQVYAPYDYSKAIEVSLKEFVPDHLVLLGPGSSLGGATAQVLIANNWLQLKNKQDFTALQQKKPFILAMGREEQRELVVG